MSSQLEDESDRVRRRADELRARLSILVSPARSPRSDGAGTVNEALSVRTSSEAVSPLGANSAEEFAGVNDWEPSPGATIESCTLPLENVDVTENGKTKFGVRVRLQSGMVWVVYKRYSDFRRLHKQLKSRLSSDRIRRLQFPMRRWVLNRSAKVIETRRQMLEAYVTDLLAIRPFLCRELFNFFEVYTRIKDYERSQRATRVETKSQTRASTDEGDVPPNSTLTGQNIELVSHSNNCSSVKAPATPATVDSCDDRVHDNSAAYAECLSIKDTLPELCQHMNELRSTSEDLVERLGWTHSHLSEIQPVAPAETTDEFARLVVRFHAFLIQHQNRSNIERLVSTRTLVKVLHEFNCDVDALEVRITTYSGKEIKTEGPNWKKTLDDAVRDVETYLVRTWAANTGQLREELPNEQAQRDAMTLLNNETKQPGSHELLETATAVVTRLSTTQVEAVPERFIPEHDIQRESQPFNWGSSGTVYRGKWGGANVVIKYVKDLPVDMSAFLRENKIWHKARHPHVVTYYGACHLSKPCFFVSEDAVNGNVADYLPKAKRDGRSLVWRMMHGAALGLHFLHQNGIVHGDLKCNNLLVDAKEMVKLTDFGMSFVVGSNPVACGGPVRWTAPECIIKEQARSFQSDLYSFGMCIVEAVTAKVPWGAGVVDTVLIDELEHNRFLPRPDGFQDAQWALVLSLCALEPHDRPHLSDVVTQLKKFADAETASERARK